MASSPPSARAGRPRDPEIDKTLLKTALAEMAAHGFTGMSIDRISQVSGIGKPAIYRRHADKTALAIAALELLTTGEGPEDSGDLIEDVTRQLQLAHGNLERNGSVPMLGTLLAERDRQPELIGLYRERLFAPRSRKIAARLDAARHAGELRADADIDAATLLLTGFLAANYVADRKINAAALRRAATLVIDGLRATPRPPSLGKPASPRAQRNASAPRRPTDR